jgi:hypothetical protein
MATSRSSFSTAVMTGTARAADPARRTESHRLPRTSLHPPFAVVPSATEDQMSRIARVNPRK